MCEYHLWSLSASSQAQGSSCDPGLANQRRLSPRLQGLVRFEHMTQATGGEPKRNEINQTDFFKKQKTRECIVLRIKEDRITVWGIWGLCFCAKSNELVYASKEFAHPFENHSLYTLSIYGSVVWIPEINACTCVCTPLCCRTTEKQLWNWCAGSLPEFFRTLSYTDPLCKDILILSFPLQ